MLGFIKAIIIILFCVSAAGAVMRFINREFNPLPYIISWGLLTAAVFLTHNYFVILAIVLLIKLFIVKNDIHLNVSFFLALIVTMPYSFLFPVVPGINLFDVSIVHILSMVFFLPLAVVIMRSDEITLDKPDFLVMAFFLILIVGNFRESSEWEFTYFSAIRDTADMFLAYMLPYFVISRGVRGFDGINKVLPGLLMGGLTMAFFAYFEMLLKWRPYVDVGFLVGTMPAIESLYDFRNGFLRVTASLTGPITFGFYLSIVLAAMLYYMRVHDVARFVRLGLGGILLFSIFLTGSRAALLGGLVFILLYFLYSLTPGARRVIVIPMLLLAIGGFFVQKSLNPVDQGAELTSVDQYGTFDYRAELFKTSIQVIPDHLLLGTRKYRADERMQELVQGQGIIDMVNGFIHITIEYGLVALLILLGILLRAYRVVTRLNSAEEDDDAGAERSRMAWFSQAFAALLVALIMQFSFTSYAATIVPLLWITLALIRVLQVNMQQQDDDEFRAAAKAPVRQQAAPSRWGQSGERGISTR